MDNDDDDIWTPEQEVEDIFQRVTQQTLSGIWLWTRNRDGEEAPSPEMMEALIQRICDAITPEAVEDFRLMRQAEDQRRIEQQTVKETAVVRKPNDIGATWHRPLTEHTVVCGKPIPENAATGDIGDPDVHRTFLCRACLRAGDNLHSLRVRRQMKESRLRRG